MIRNYYVVMKLYVFESGGQLVKYKRFSGRALLEGHLRRYPSDKGQSTVVMESYETKVEEVLSKRKYRLLAKDPTSTIEKKNR